jgi:nucleoside-diphosphate-sugar epimerase
VLVAGATGAIGRPLMARLLAAGHDVVGTTRSPDRAAELEAAGVTAAILDAFDADAVRRVVAGAEPEVVIAQMTSLPSSPRAKAMREGLTLTSALRREAVPVLVDAAREAGARRVVAQSISFVTGPPEPVVHDESAPLWDDAPDPAQRSTIAAVRDMEAAVVDAPGIEGIVLRYGFFYGPGTWYERDGAMGKELRRRRLPVIGDGRGLSSFVHVDDAAAATIQALDHGSPGVYNVTDADPATWTQWTTEAAALLGAKPPRRVPAWLARRVAGAIAVHYATTLPGNASDKAQRDLDWHPRSRAEGFADAFGPRG